jgi:hypothetical protein
MEPLWGFRGIKSLYILRNEVYLHSGHGKDRFDDNACSGDSLITISLLAPDESIGTLKSTHI